MVEPCDRKAAGCRNTKAAMIVLPTAAAAFLYAGIMAGLHGDWMRMSLSFFAGVLLVFVGMMGFFVMRLKDRLTYLQDRFQVGHEAIPKVARRVEAVVGIFLILSTTGCMMLSIVAGFHAHWFRMGIHLTACALIAVVCTGLLAVMSIGRRLARLEQLPAGTRKAEDA